MQRARAMGRARNRPDAPVRRQEVKNRLGGEQMVNADGAAEVGEVGATAHAYMLASVNDLAGGRVGERTRPATEAIAQSSSNVTLNHARASAVAAASPARPPPRMRTVITPSPSGRAMPGGPGHISATGSGSRGRGIRHSHAARSHPAARGRCAGSRRNTARPGAGQEAALALPRESCNSAVCCAARTAGAASARVLLNWTTA